MKALVLALLLIAPPALAAQDSVIVIDPDAPPTDSTERRLLPPEILEEVLLRYNDSATTRLQGDLHVPAGNRLEGQIAVFRGIVTVAGEIVGPFTLVNGRLSVLPGGRIHGDVLVIGGRITIAPGGSIEGSRREFWEAAPIFRSADGMLVVRERRRTLADFGSAQKSFRTGKVRTTLLLATGRTYNRIEGLPIVFGPDFDWKASDDLLVRLRLHGILRTAGDRSSLTRDFGYLTRVDLRFGGPRGFGAGVELHNMINGIEDHPLGRSEVGWSSFLLQRDHRDYFLAVGVGGSLFAYPARKLKMEVSLRRERQGSVLTNDPWSLFRNSDRWRPNPLIDDGHYLSAGLGIELDTRNHPDLTTAGWWVQARYEHSSSDDVAPVVLPTAVRPALPAGGDYSFERVWLDARRFARLTPGSRLNLRVRAAGWIGGDPLPVQARHSLGGPDLLPGYGFRAFTCAPGGASDPARPALCDRVVSVQTEFRSRLSLNWGYHYRDREQRGLDRFIGIAEADLVFFADAGKAWLSGDGPGRVPNNRFPSLKEWKADIGGGLDAGGIGLYLAKALTDPEPVRLFVRLERRF